MSAYITHPNHINVIVSYFVDYRHMHQLYVPVENKEDYQYLTRENAHIVAKVLRDENIKSVDSRYNETNDDDYEFKFIPQAKQFYTIGEIGKALAGLEYQSCETADYFESHAYQILNYMRKHLLNSLAERDEADTWEICEVKGLRPTILA